MEVLELPSNENMKKISLLIELQILQGLIQKSKIAMLESVMLPFIMTIEL